MIFNQERKVMEGLGPFSIAKFRLTFVVAGKSSKSMLDPISFFHQEDHHTAKTWRGFRRIFLNTRLMRNEGIV
jgi:hypothetical protein